MRRAMLALCVAIGLAAGQVGAGALSVRIDEGLPSLENDWISLKIAPGRGGRVCSFITKGDSVEHVPAREGWGMFHDLFAQQSYPGELLNSPYEFEVLERGPRRAAVKLWRVVRGDYNGSQPEVAGIRLEKTYCLFADKPALYVEVALVNTTAQGKLPAYWVQHVFRAGPDRWRNEYFRPSVRGLNRTRYDESAGTAIRPDVVCTPVAGWTATLDPSVGSGLVFLMDYDYLRWLYNCQSVNTTEWFYDKVMIPGGRTFRTNMTCIPVQGFSGIRHASEHVLADVEPSKGEVTFSLRAATGALEGVKVSFFARDTDGNRLSKPLAVRFGSVGLKPIRKSAPLPASVDPAECVIVFEIRWEGGTEKQEAVFSERPLRSELLGGLGEEDVYYKSRPAKKKRFLKPDRIVFRPQRPVRCFVAAGPFHRLIDVPAAVRGLAWQEAVVGKERCGRWSGNALSRFPPDYEHLMGYHVVALLNVDAAAIGLEGLEMIRDFVKAGGGLLVTGGPFAFGPGGYAGTALEEILPLEGYTPFEMAPVKDAAWQPAGESPLTDGLRWEAGPVSPWVHRLRARPGSTVLIEAAGQPILVTGTYGKGRVAAFLAAPLGEAVQGKESVAFWQWSDWPRLLRQVLSELARTP